MGLVTTMREVHDNTSQEELARLSNDRPIMVDGSLSELVTQALNIAYSKRDMTTGKPFYGEPNASGNSPPGGSSLVDILQPDSPEKPKVVKPSLESMQQQQQVEAEQVASVIAGALNANDKDATSYLKQDPLLVYALPKSGNVPEEMSANIDMYHDSGAINVNDFVFVFTDAREPTDQIDYKVVDLNQKVKDYEQRGARVYADLQSFLADLPVIRRK